MGSFTDHVEDKVLDLMFGASSTLSTGNPSVYYLGLSTTTITDAGGNITEPSSGAYARVAATNNKTTFSVSSSGSVTNSVTLSFPAATGSWGTILDFFLANSSTASATANIYAYGTLAASKTIQNGDTASFSASALTITLT